MFQCLRIRCSSGTRHLNTQTVGILGVPLNKGQRKEGVSKGPKAIRRAGLQVTLEKIGLTVKEYGDVECPEIEDDRPDGIVRNPLTVSGALKNVYKRVESIVRNGEFCLTLGGDHSLGMGTVYGHHSAHPGSTCLLWIDAHADINTALTTSSGNLHGMPISFLIRELQPYLHRVRGFEWLKPCLHATDVAFIGLRDVEPIEMSLLKASGIKIFSMRDIDRYGIHNITQQALDHVNPKGQKHLHVSFDIDSVDVTLAPSTGTAVPGGLTRREALSIAEDISERGNLIGLDLVEVNPMIGSQKEAENTVAMAIDVIAAFCGQRRPVIGSQKELTLTRAEQL